jgi:phospho-N-acetylmuramoyl-pentapeptide-transferase
MDILFGIATKGELSLVFAYLLVSCIVSFLWAPVLINLLYRFNITRRAQYDVSLGIETRKNKAGTPVMGGLLVILTVAIITLLFNWDRQYTWVPVGVMILSALLGGVDDVLNIYGEERRSRKIGHIFRLIRVHKNIWARLWYVITLPWSFYRRAATILSRHPGKGVHVHEKLLLQFIAGAISAWWIYFKLGEGWQSIDLPFAGALHIGWLIIPLIIFVVMFTANAVNIADGMDGLAGGMMIPTFSALALLSWFKGFDSLAILNAVTAGSLITYTYFNIKPARFQMGDVGSLGLGALLAINALALNLMATLPFLGFMFYVEAISVLIQVFGRTLFGKRVFKMAPIHHHFELVGWSEEKTIMRFWIIHLAFVIFGIWLALQ